MTEFSDIWTDLLTDAEKKPTGRIVRAVGKIKGNRVFLGIDCESKKRLFLAEMDISSPYLKGFPNWREIKYAIAEPSPFHDKCFAMRLESADYTDVFSAMVRDLILSLDETTDMENRRNVLRGRLQKWNHFLKEYGFKGLPEEKIRGIFGELWVLREHMFPHFDNPNVVRFWKGPESGIHDFRRGQKAIETKTTGKTDPESIAVTNEFQLDDSDLDNLWLHVIILSEGTESGESLPDVINSIRLKFNTNKEDLDNFNAKLLAAGYLDESANLYSRKYTILNEFTFKVEDGFPRLIQPPQGIHGVKYKVRINAMHPYGVNTLDAVKDFGAD